MQKGLAPVLIVLIITVVVLGGYFGFTSLRGVPPKPDNEAISIPNSPTPTESTSSADMTNWKTYNGKYFTFKFPNTWKLKPLSSDQPEEVYLERDASYSIGGGFAGGNALIKGVVISFTERPLKDLSDESLNHEFGADVFITRGRMFGSLTAVEVSFANENYYGLIRNIFLPYRNRILEIKLYIGDGETSNNPSDVSRRKNYVAEFEDVLSAFRFTQ